MMSENTQKEIMANELRRWLDDDKRFTLVDTLGGDHFQRVHLPGASNACVFEVTFIDQFKNITEDKEAEIVLYGSSSRSMDATKAAEKLVREGYRSVSVLQGGLEAWRSAGLALAGEGIDEPDDPQTQLELQDRSYNIDTNRSSIEWTGRNPNSRHFGNISIVKGQLTVKDGNITGGFDIDMQSITNINLEGDELQPVLIAHLQSDDFFHTDLFPRATFRILSTEQVQEPYLTIQNYLIKGILKLKGVEARQDFMATITKTAENDLVLEAHFDIDRTRWNILYGSTRFFEHLGMHMVFDPISIQLRIIAS